MRKIGIWILILLHSTVYARLDRTPEDQDRFEAYFKRQMVEGELVFTYESGNSRAEAAGSAFLIDIFGSTYIATNRHVLDSIILGGHRQFQLRNRFGRQLLITSPFYYMLKEQKGVTDDMPSNIKEVTHNDIGNDLVLIPYSMGYYKMDALKPSVLSARINETAIAYGNTEGQGFINSKEGIINYADDFCFGIISGARKGNSGGPVLSLNNEVLGMLSAGGGPRGPDGADQSVCIRMDRAKLSELYEDKQFEIYEFPHDVVHYYTAALVANYKPEPHHSRDKATPHLSMGMAGGGLGSKNGLDPLNGDESMLEGYEPNERDIEAAWDMKRRTKTRPLYCYNWDVIPRDRLIKLCKTYGQTAVEFIPREWIKIYYHDTIVASVKGFEAIEEKYSQALRGNKFMHSLASRDEKMDYAKKNGFFPALRDTFNSRPDSGQKMRLSGEVVEISKCIENLDAGL